MVIWAQIKDGRFEVVSITKEILDDAIDVMLKSYFIHENLSKAVELHKHPNAMKELAQMCRTAAADGVSLAVVEKTTGKIVCASFNKIQVRASANVSAMIGINSQPMLKIPLKAGEQTFYEKYEAICTEPSAKSLLRFMNDSGAAVNLFSKYKVDCMMEVMFLATLPEYESLGIVTYIGTTLMKMIKRLQAGDNVKVSITDQPVPLQPVPQLIYATCTTSKTQKVAQKLNFDMLNKIPYTEYSFNGKSFAERIGKEPPSSVLIANKL